ncbi:MAG: hypothetical protein ACJAVV_000588 [Alphaproteobacteria bacterium]|jgi:hypothetical protein
MRKHQGKVKHSVRKGALLMALASNDHKSIAALLKNWIHLACPNREAKSPKSPKSR